MRKLTTIILLILLSSSLLHSQDTITTYLDRENIECSKESAFFYRKAYPDSTGIWIVEKYYMNGKLSMFGKYLDKKLKKQQGTAAFYHYNGRISKTGQYLDNKMIGIWKNYYTNGEIESIGKITNDKKDSVWSYYNVNSKNLFGKINYINGKAEGESKWYYESGKICEIAIYKNGKIETKIDYDENGNIIKIEEKDRSAELIDNNFREFLEENLKYPEELVSKEKEGIVLFHFLVRKDGEIYNVEFEKSDETLFNQEALRVFKLIKYMKPARDHGQIVEQELTLPIVFRVTY